MKELLSILDDGSDGLPSGNSMLDELDSLGELQEKIAHHAGNIEKIKYRVFVDTIKKRKNILEERRCFTLNPEMRKFLKTHMEVYDEVMELFYEVYDEEGRGN